MEHKLVVLDEGKGWRRAACTCHESQTSPSKQLTQAEAEAWHRMHVGITQRFGAVR